MILEQLSMRLRNSLSDERTWKNKNRLIDGKMYGNACVIA
jgi:hypothetical protein